MDYCKHREKDRSPRADGKRGYHCNKCGRDVDFRVARMFHGTNSGYERHRKKKRHPWGWPACGPCSEAHRVWSLEYAHQDGESERRKERDRARQTALRRLAALYPTEFHKLYVEELSIIRDGGQVALGGLRAQLAAYTQGINVKALARAVAGGYASMEERRRFATIRGIKGQMAEVEKRVAQAREPRRGR